MTETPMDLDVSGREALTVGVVAESGADERRVALVPKAVAALAKNGVAVIVEAVTDNGEMANTSPDQPTLAWSVSSSV